MADNNKSEQKPTTNDKSTDKPQNAPAKPVDPKDTATPRNFRSTDGTPKFHCEDSGNG